MKFSTILTILAVAIPVGILYESGSHEQTPKSVNDLLKSEISMEVHTDLPAPVRKPAIAERPVDTEEDGWTRVTQVATTPRKPVAQAIPLDVISWDMQEEDWHYSNVMDDQYDVEAQIAVEAQLQEEVQAGLNNLMSMFKEVYWSQFSATALAEDMLISQNIDGEMIARTLAKLDIGAVRGSSDKAGKDKGGRAALRGMLKMLKNGDSIGITPDGPRGPGMQSKEGLIVLARLSGVPILPVAGASNRARIMGSWDRFNLHLPFARGLIKWGEPIHVPRDADDQTMDAIRLQLDDTLNTLSAETRHKIGVPPLEALS